MGRCCGETACFDCDTLCARTKQRSYFNSNGFVTFFTKGQALSKISAYWPFETFQKHWDHRLCFLPLFLGNKGLKLIHTKVTGGCNSLCLSFAGHCTVHLKSNMAWTVLVICVYCQEDREAVQDDSKLCYCLSRSVHSVYHLHMFHNPCLQSKTGLLLESIFSYFWAYFSFFCRTPTHL